MLLGIGVRPSIYLNGRVTTNDDTLAAYQTVYGWTVEGSLPSKSKTQTIPSLHIASVNVEHDISRFWDMEELPSVSELSPEEERAVTHFVQTHTRLPNGCYQVSLPKIDGDTSLGCSRELAVKRYLSNESLCSAKASGMLISKEFWNTSAWNMQSQSQGRTCVSQKTFVFICLCMVFIRPALQPPSYGWYVMPQHLQAMEDS